MINKVTLIGRVGKDPIIKHFDNGGAVAEFSLATDDSYKNKQGEKIEQTDWHNIRANGKLVDVIEKYVKKGMEVYVDGKIKYRKYSDKDGIDRYITEIQCDTFKMIGGKGQKPADTQENTQGQSAPAVDDDIPF